MAFHLHTSNDIERLAAKMSGLLNEARKSGPDADPFYTETVVINSRGMESWLLQQLAAPKSFSGDLSSEVNTTGVQANIRFVMPNDLLNFGLLHLDEATHRWSELGERVTDLFDRDVLAWRLYHLLGPLPDTEPDVFAGLRAYMIREDGNTDRRRFQLAREIADVFDQYEIHRPEMLAAWRDSRESDELKHSNNAWQPQLWRSLASAGGQSRDQRIAAFVKRYKSTQFAPGQLKRVWLFGISTMPPLYLQFFRALGQKIDVHLFLRNPSPHYWLDDERKIDTIKLQLRLAELDEATLDADALESGNSLLNSFGGLIRDFLGEILEQCSGGDEETGGLADPSDSALFAAEPPGPSTLLGALQNGIFNASNDGQEAADCQAALSSGDDCSLLLHDCHSRMREIEVLRDQLLNWFNSDQSRLPRHVVIMAPDIEDYVPVIEAIFNRRARNAADYIPYTIADRTAAAESAVVQAFLALLKLPRLRFRASEVFDLLGVDAIATACRLSEEDVTLLQRWARDANIRWGIDAPHRKDLDFEELGEANSWRAGLDRLFGGYALGDFAAADTSDTAFSGIAPFNEVEGSNAILLGKLAQFIDDLCTFRDRIGSPMPATEWCTLLSETLDRFFVGDDSTYADIAAVRHALENMTNHAAAAKLAESLPLAVVESYLSGALRSSQSSSLFCRGRVTFCSMLPMRSIPADFVWLLGMNDGSFPRQDPARDFNLIQTGARRRCDRSRRLDDRYMFLEAIISARHRLHISYNGRSIQDNSERQPSTVVRELLALIKEQLELPDEAFKTLSGHLVIAHPLHSFSKAYFDSAQPRLQTYSKSAFDAAQKLYASDRAELDVLFRDNGPVKAPQADPFANPSAEDMEWFFQMPAAYLLKNRLGLYLKDDSVTLEDDEPVDLGTLTKYTLNQRILDVVRDCQWQGLTEDAMATASSKLFDRLHDTGDFAPGERNRAWFDDQWATALRFLETSVTIDDKCWTVQKLLDNDISNINLRYRFSGIKHKDRVTVLVHHLVVLSEAPQTTTVLAGLDASNNPVIEVLYAVTSSDADDQPERAAQLDTNRDYFNDLYQRGMAAPLPFSPAASFAYAIALDAGEAAGKTGEDAAVEAADAEWLGNDNKVAHDGVEALANRYCFGRQSLCNRDSFAGHAAQDFFLIRFEAIAKSIYDAWKFWTKPPKKDNA